MFCTMLTRYCRRIGLRLGSNCPAIIGDNEFGTVEYLEAAWSRICSGGLICVVKDEKEGRKSRQIQAVHQDKSKKTKDGDGLVVDVTKCWYQTDLVSYCAVLDWTGLLVHPEHDRGVNCPLDPA